MAQTIIRWAVWVAVWVLRRWAVDELASPAAPIDEATTMANMLIAAQRGTKQTGAWKNAQVKIGLYRAFPHRRRRELNLLVEQLVQGV